MSVLGGLYGRVTALRRAWYRGSPLRMRHLRQPVISIGNLVVGGSGKTPLTAAVARLLVSAGERPSILSRGYARLVSSDGVVVVGDGERLLATVAESGDEPYMLSRTLPGVPVLVSSDRYLAGRLAEERFGCSVHLLDDGFQHLQLARDVDLLVMSPADLDERLLPSGRLREPLAAAGAADALVVAGGEDEARRVAAITGVAPVFRAIASYGPLRPITSTGTTMLQENRRVVAVAAIARPDRFFSALRDLGWDVLRTIVFRDHHWFSTRDLDAIRRAAAECGAGAVVTTEKDAVRLPPAAMAGEPVPWGFLPMEVSVHPPDVFAAWIAERLVAARRAASTGVGA